MYFHFLDGWIDGQTEYIKEIKALLIDKRVKRAKRENFLMS